MSKLKEFADGIWTVEGPEVSDMGELFPTRMTVVRLSNGAIWVDSPIPASFADISEVASLGLIKYLIAATPRHVWRLEGWHTLFPEAQLWASPHTPMTLKKVDLPMTRILGDEPPAEWTDDLDQLLFQGNPFLEEVLFYHKRSRTLILDDLIQIGSLYKGPLSNTLIRIGGVAEPGGVPTALRMSFTDRSRARRSLERLLALDFDKLIIAHGPCKQEGAKKFVEDVFDWL
jgi:hypothetical protein